MSITNDEMEAAFRAWQADSKGGHFPKMLTSWALAHCESLKLEMSSLIDANIKSGTLRMKLPRMPSSVREHVLANYKHKYRIYKTYAYMQNLTVFQIITKHPVNRINQPFEITFALDAKLRKDRSKGKCVMCRKRKRVDGRLRCALCLDYLWQSRNISEGIGE